MSYLLLLMALSMHAEGRQPTLAPDPHVLEGVVVSAGSGKLAMKDERGKEHSFAVESSTKIVVNGKPGKLEDLKLGMKIKVMVDAANKLLSIETIDDAKQLP